MTLTVNEIEQAIKALPQEEWEELNRRLADYRFQKWDSQIEDDLAAGRLDTLIAEAEADYAAGRILPLPTASDIRDAA